MKKAFATIALLLISMSLAFATTKPTTIIDAQNGVVNFGGVTAGGVELTSQLTAYNAPNDGLDLGTVTVVSGPLNWGVLTGNTIGTVGTYSNYGSVFIVVGNGTNGVYNGVIFNGFLVGTAFWSVSVPQYNVYTFSATFSGKLRGHKGQTGGTLTESFTYDGTNFYPTGGNINFVLNPVDNSK
jgi:hypothetical protein